MYTHFPKRNPSFAVTLTVTGWTFVWWNSCGFSFHAIITSIKNYYRYAKQKGKCLSFFSSYYKTYNQHHTTNPQTRLHKSASFILSPCLDSLVADFFLVSCKSMFCIKTWLWYDLICMYNWFTLMFYIIRSLYILS